MTTDARAFLDSTAWATDDGVYAMRDALLAVLDLHKPGTEYVDPQYDEFLTQCDGCYEDWPCKTVRAIDKTLGANDD